MSEPLLRSLEESSGGACELVSPKEDMSERIVRHFRHIHQTAVNNSRVHWPADPLRQSPSEIDAVYAGDTLHVFCWLPGTLARMATHSRLSSLDDEVARELAVDYQLVTARNSCVLVKQRDEDEKVEEIPALRKVPHQLAAAWGGPCYEFRSYCTRSDVVSEF